MRKIDISQLVPGHTSEEKLYSEKGELLISEGVEISQQHLDRLRARNIFDLFAPTDEREDVEQILSGRYRRTSGPQQPDSRRLVQKPKASKAADTAEEPQAPSAPAAEDVSLRLDAKLRKRSRAELPMGIPLRSSATQLEVGERTDDYKEQVVFSYQQALEEITFLLKKLAHGKDSNGGAAAKIVRRFVNVFTTDRNILLNLSGIKHSDDYIFHHSLNVCLLAVNIAASFGYSKKQVTEIGTGALLHDVGMLLIPDSIRFKKGRLSEREWFEVQKHPILGANLLDKIRHIPDSVPFITYQVHERENGTGYPKQRRTHLIHRFAKLVQVADIFEALSSPRSYRKALTPHEGVEYLIKMMKKGFISEEFLRALLAYTSLFPVGSLVKLGNNTVARVVHAHSDVLNRPMVSILTDPGGRMLKKDLIYQEDLKKNAALQIIGALRSDFLKGIELMDGF